MSKILLSLCSCMLHCPLTSCLASCLQDSWAMPGSCWEQEGDRAVPSSSQAIPAAHASWGWVTGCCGLLPVAVGDGSGAGGQELLWKPQPLGVSQGGRKERLDVFSLFFSGIMH